MCQANVCGADLRMQRELMREQWDLRGRAVYDALFCLKPEDLPSGTPAAGETWVDRTLVGLPACIWMSIKGVLYDDVTQWPAIDPAPFYPRQHGARHIDWRWWKPWI